MHSPDSIRALALDLNGAVETFPFGPETRVFKVAGKIFALDTGPAVADGSPFSVSVKASPEDVPLLRTVPGIGPGYHLNKRHWVTLSLDASRGPAAPDDLVEELVARSHELIVQALPKAQRLALGGRA